MSLTPPPKVQKLQEALHAKAKGSPDYRFYALYDKVYGADVLEFAYDRCRANGGAAGVDGQTFEDIEAYGLERWLDELAEELQEANVSTAAGAAGIHPQAGRQATTAGHSDASRIAWCRWRRCWSWSRSSRPTCSRNSTPTARSAARWTPCRQVQALLNTGHTEVVDADLSGYFDSIPHAELMKSVARRVSDRHLLPLIKMWLEAPVEETTSGDDTTERPATRTRAGDSARGSALAVAGESLHATFVLGWKMLGHERRLDAHIVNYADDFVICCRGTADEAMTAMRAMMARLKLTVNETKTRRCQVRRGDVRLPGLHDRPCARRRRASPTSGRDRRRRRSSGSAARSASRRAGVAGLLDVEELVGRLNRKLDGWANYFCLGPVSKAYRAVDRHARRRLRQWLCRKHQVEGRGTSRFPDAYLHQTLGLIRLEGRTTQLRVSERMSPCPRAGCGKSARPVR